MHRSSKRSIVLPPIKFVGMLRSHASWAAVSRRLLGGLVERGHSLDIYEVVSDRYDPSVIVETPLAERIGRPRGGDDIVLTFEPPPSYGALFGAAGIRIGLLVWEATQWPPEWVDQINDHLTLAVVPSSFCASTLEASGVSRSRIAIVPHGVDSRSFHPAPRAPRRRCRVLFVGTPARRKGLDLLLEAYESAVRPSEEVELVIKLTDYPDAARRPYLLQQWARRVDDLSRRGYKIEVITGHIGEEELGDLYRTADIVCHPYRGEGFGMTTLEGMACGAAVMATDWSGPTDFLNGAARIPVASMVPAEEMLPGCETRRFGAEMAEPDADMLAEQFRAMIGSSGAALRERGLRDAEAARAWRWDVAVDKLEQVLETACEAQSDGMV